MTFELVANTTRQALSDKSSPFDEDDNCWSCVFINLCKWVTYRLNMHITSHLTNLR
jgi:hypothetical protein